MVTVQPFSHISDYKEIKLPSAVYSPSVRAVYAKIYSAQTRNDLSFSVCHEGTALGYCLLCADDGHRGKLLWSLGAPATFWLTESCPQELRNHILKVCLSEFKKRIIEYSSFSIYFADFFMNGALLPHSSYLMQEQNCNASLAFTHVVDLSLSEEQMRANIRDRYKNTVNKGCRNFSFSIIDKDSLQLEHIKLLRECHISASGRDVYSEFIWEAWRDECARGKAFLVLAFQDGKVKGASLYTHTVDTVYYAIGAYDRALQNSGLSHASMWTAMSHAKARGNRYFEVGRSDFSCLHPNISEKEMTIGFFKRGFGGDNRPVLYLHKG